MRFRPCIDLHNGVVKQIVGTSLSDSGAVPLKTNFKADRPAGWYAKLYRKDHLYGGHMIKLGPGNDKAARSALAAWPGGLQVGGGINADNAASWLDAGASAVIVTSWVFYDGFIHMDRLKELTAKVGNNRLVLDLSCRKQNGTYKVVTNRWQNFTKEAITYPFLDQLSGYCSEFLVHGVDVEGKCAGIETELVEHLGKWAGIPITYAGGIQSLSDIRQIEALGNNAIDFTVGSALDLFGGIGLSYQYLADQYGQ